SVDVEKVEEEIDGGNLGDEGLRRGANVHALLQQTKVAMAAGVQRDDFAVENSLMRCQSLRKPGEFWVTIGDFDSVAWAHGELAIFDPSERANAVPFDFEKPVGAGERLVRERGEHGLELGRHGCLLSAVQFADVERPRGSLGGLLVFDFVEGAAGQD